MKDTMQHYIQKNNEGYSAKIRKNSLNQYKKNEK